MCVVGINHDFAVSGTLQSPCAMLLTVTLTQSETMDPGNYERTVRYTGIKSLKECFLPTRKRDAGTEPNSDA
jgi:hypothetical protein